jgi:hypothetical protein
METKREQFMRIAMATLKGRYPFKPQRRAVAAKMWTKYIDKYDFDFKIADGELL